MPATDHALLKQWVTEHEAEALAALCRSYAGMVYASCHRVLQDAIEAEDAAQECFETLATLRAVPRSPLGPWLHRVAVNRSIDLLRGRQRRAAREQRYAKAQPAQTDPAWDDIYPHVDEIVNGLPEKTRRVIVLHFFQGRTHDQIAREEGVTRSAVSRRIERGIERVREELRGRGIGVSATVLAALVAGRPADAAPPTLLAAVGRIALSGAGIGTGMGASLSVAAWGKGAGFAAAVAIVAVGGWLGLQMMRDTSSPAVPQEQVAAAEMGQEANPITEATVAAPPEVDPKIEEEVVPSLSDAEEDEAFSLRGRVYDSETGEGIENVVVFAQPATESDVTGASGRTQTDSDGIYAFQSLSDGTYVVAFSNVPAYPDRTPVRGTRVVLADGVPISGIDFPLIKGTAIRGVVQTAQGDPAAKARVRGLVPGDLNPFDTWSDNNGRFVLHIPHAAPSVTLHAATVTVEPDESRRWKSAALVDVPVGREGLEGLVFVLNQPMAASISGNVVDLAGNPVTDVFIDARDPGINEVHASGVDDSDGTFHLTGLGAGEYMLEVYNRNPPIGTRAMSYYPQKHGVVRLAAGESVSGVRIVMHNVGDAVVSGEVVDVNGVPITGADVMMDVPGARTKTDDYGRFLLTGLVQASHKTVVEHPDYLPATLELMAGTTDAVITLRKSARLAGRVVSGDTGRPLPAFKFGYVYGELRAFDSRLHSAGRPVTSDDGTFALDGLYEGVITVAAWAPGFEPAWSTVSAQGEKTTEVELKLHATSPLEGMVINQAGEPVADAYVYFVENIEVPDMERASAAVTDAAGRFTLTTMPRMTEWVGAWKPGYGAGVMQLAHDRQIVLPPAASLQGRILYEGVPPCPTRIEASYADGEYRPRAKTWPEADGSFRLDGLTPGEVTVEVLSCLGDFSVETTTRLESGQTHGLEVLFERGTALVEGVVSGDLADSSGEALLERLSTTHKNKLTTKLGDDGSYRFENVWAGDLVLTIRLHNRSNPQETEEYTIALRVREGEAVRQDIQL